MEYVNFFNDVRYLSIISMRISLIVGKAKQRYSVIKFGTYSYLEYLLSTFVLRTRG